MIQVYKFGGASIATTERMKHIGNIILQPDEPVLVVISAIANVTNQLEEVVSTFFTNQKKAIAQLQNIKEFHINRCKELLVNPQYAIDAVNNHFVEAEWILEDPPNDSFAYVYDQIVSIGELASTTIMIYYLNEQQNNSCVWKDARGFIRTSREFKDASIQWEITTSQISTLQPVLTSQSIITQGFIGSSMDNETTTLGREGSDFSGAIFAYCLQASKYTIWKDVTGMYTADPHQYDFAKKIDELSYREAVEMAYYGAKVIHPKTIKPLQNLNIPLVVRSFLELSQEGTSIGSYSKNLPSSVFIEKKNQVKLTFLRRDFSFFEEHDIAEIMHLLHEHHLSIQLVQRSAIKYTVVVDDKPSVKQIVDQLQEKYTTESLSRLQLNTLRHFRPQDIEELRKNKDIVIEQRNEITYQILYKNT